MRERDLLNRNRTTAPKKLDVDALQAPDVRFSPVYAWVWNGVLTRERIDAQLAEMKRLGVRRFYIIPEPKSFRPVSMPTEMEPDYLTEPYFEEFAYAIDQAVALGMQCWLYDEGGWPSGGACGKVLWAHPELSKRTLAHETRRVAQGSIYRKSSEEVVAAFADGCAPIEEGHIFPQDAQITEYQSRRLFFPAPGIPDYPDSLIPESMQAFIEMTHEGYKRRLHRHFGQALQMVFTDEPKTPPLPFREELCRAYEQTYGESILPRLPVLAEQVEITEENAVYLRRWYDLCSRKFCENYLLPYRQWCHDNALLFTGHMDKDDEPLGCLMNNGYHILRALRCMDVPGVDAIWRQIFPAKPYQWNGEWFAENRFFPRYASSAAAQNGTDQAMIEIFGVYGNGVTYDQMRFCAGFVAIRGINLINPMLFTYARKGHMMAGEQPAFDEKQAGHRDLGTFNRYLEQLCYLFSVGERVCDTALYYPVHDMWGKIHAREAADAFDALGWAMERRQMDFDIVDDDVILASDALDAGKIHMGKARYRRVMIPANTYLPEQTRAALRRFERAGGQILSCAEACDASIQTVGETSSLRVMQRIAENGRLICLFNEGLEARAFRIRLPIEAGDSDNSIYLIRPACDEIERLTVTSGEAGDTQANEVEVFLESGESCALFLTDQPLTARPPWQTRGEQRLDGPFLFRAEQRFVLGEMQPESIEITQPPVPVALGNWASIVGESFSGSCRYELEFARPEEASGDVRLDLGDVRYSCEALLNGISLGVRIMPPYRYDLPAALLRQSNHLSVRVSNTPGNEYYHTRTFDKWAPWQLSTYHQKQLEFCRDTLCGGLYGPVRLIY